MIQDWLAWSLTSLRNVAWLSVAALRSPGSTATSLRSGASVRALSRRAVTYAKWWRRGESGGGDPALGRHAAAQERHGMRLQGEAQAGVVLHHLLAQGHLRQNDRPARGRAPPLPWRRTAAAARPGPTCRPTPAPAVPSPPRAPRAGPAPWSGRRRRGPGPPGPPARARRGATAPGDRDSRCRAASTSSAAIGRLARPLTWRKPRRSAQERRGRRTHGGAARLQAAVPEAGVDVRSAPGRRSPWAGC